MPNSDFIAYFDESGDHGLKKIDPGHPVFVLCGCVFRITDYLTRDLGAFSAIKFKHFGHDAVVFHSRAIRKQIGPFQILANMGTRTAFMDDIAGYFAGATGTLIAAGIDKVRHIKQYKYPADPYELSLLFCLERLYAFVRDTAGVGGAAKTLTCVFEKRGDAEDKLLAAHFTRICAGQNMWGALPFQMVFADKQTNMPGLQIADLAAYPIARRIMNPKTPNPSYLSIRPRFRKGPIGQVLGYGLKVFP